MLRIQGGQQRQPDPFPCPIVLPAHQPAMGRRVVAQVRRQVTPATAATHQIQDRIDRLPVMTALATARRLRGKQGLNQRPLRIRQIRVVVAHATNLRKNRPPRQAHSKIGSCLNWSISRFVI